MASLPTLQLCIGFYNLRIFKKLLMEFRKELIGWPQEATLFATEQVGDNLDLCRNEPLIDFNGKAGQSKEFSLFNDVSDILDDNDLWMQDHLDLSILDDEQWPGLLDIANFAESNEFEKSFSEDALDIVIDLNFINPSLPLQGNVNEEKNEVIVPVFENSADANNDVFLEVDNNRPPSTGSSMSSEECFSPSSFTSDASDASSVIVEPECVIDVQAVEVVASYEAKETPIIRKSLKSRPAPYSLKKESRKERKKVQNKEAAARYREKKRGEDHVLFDEVSLLEAEQTSLKEKHDQLSQEVNYLKSLMKEMLEARQKSKK